MVELRHEPDLVDLVDMVLNGGKPDEGPVDKDFEGRRLEDEPALVDKGDILDSEPGLVDKGDILKGELDVDGIRDERTARVDFRVLVECNTRSHKIN